MWSFVGNFQSSDKKIEKTKIHNFGNCFTENFEIIFFLKNISWKKPRQIINTYHTEVKYSIAGVEFQATKQFILSSFGMQLYLSWWSNGLRHQTNSQKAVGSIPTRGDFFFECSFFKEFFFWNFKRPAQAGTWIYLQFFGLWMSAHYISIDSN